MYVNTCFTCATAVTWGSNPSFSRTMDLDMAISYSLNPDVIKFLVGRRVMTFCCCCLFSEFEESLRIHKILNAFARIFSYLHFYFGLFNFGVCVCV